MEQRAQKTFFLIGMALGTLDGIACLGNGRLEGVNVQLLLREDDRLALGVGRGHLFDIRRLADRLIDVALAHAAHHAIYF